MPNVPELKAELLKSAAAFETSWNLPWQAAGNDKVWGHPLLRIYFALPEGDLLELTRDLLKEASFALRGIALHVAHARKARTLMPEIRQALAADESVPVRAIAAAALGTLAADDEERRPLRELADDTHPEIKKAAIIAQRLAKSAAAVAGLVRMLERAGEDESVRAAAAAALGDLGGAGALAAIRKTLADKTAPENVRTASADALARMGGKEAIEALRAEINAAEGWVRARVLRALAHLDPESTAADVERSLAADQPWMVRIAAVEALGEIGGAAARERATGLLFERETKIRAEAAAALGKIGTTESLPVLGRALADADLFVRIQAAAAIERISGRKFGVSNEAGKSQLDLRAIERSIAAARAFIETL